MSAVSPDSVDLVVNTFERTYRRALEPGAFTQLADQQRFAFARRVALINNVIDRGDARARAQAQLARGEIDAFYFVEDRLDQSLQAVGLRREELEPLLHYSDGPLVAACLPDSPWFLYWDPEARLSESLDWITPAIDLMLEDSRVMVANPSWEEPDESDRQPGVERETVEACEGFAIGHGFSDQVFLAARSSFAAQIYRQRCIARLTYPAAHKTNVFEARVSAYMRHHERLRATSLSTSYTTDSAQGRSSYPPRGAAELLRYLRNAAVLRTLRFLPWRPACLRHTWL